MVAAAANAQIEGDDATFASVSPTTMLGTYTTISRKTIIVSRTADVVKKYGRGSEMGYLVKKAGKELKRDIELMLCSGQSGSAGSSTTVRQSPGYRAMIVNFTRATGTATTDGTVIGQTTVGAWTAQTDGTLSTFTETDLKTALGLAWSDGGDPSMVVVNTFQKRRIAAFAGATAFDGFGVNNGRTAQGVVVAGVDLYVSDFGSHKVVLDRFVGQTAVLCLDPEYMGVAWLDPISVEDIAKTGDARKKLLVGEWASVLQNPDAHAQVIGANVS